eukprot:GHVU01035489.1.p4 GENE.GHVU01035489.1~~GHVU01035489.1.p4  ORF type:complete len:125 (+),score=15.32 GHVU01035489.1:616-990(+)
MPPGPPPYTRGNRQRVDSPRCPTGQGRPRKADRGEQGGQEKWLLGRRKQKEGNEMGGRNRGRTLPVLPASPLSPYGVTRASQKQPADKLWWISFVARSHHLSVATDDASLNDCTIGLYLPLLEV